MNILKLFLSVSLLISAAAHSRVIAETEFSELLPQTAEQPELHLNGASIRSYYYLVDTYVGLLYMENPSNNAEAIINDDGYKRIIYHVLMNRVSGRRIATAMYESLQLNVSSDEAVVLEDRLNQLVKMFDSKMKRGDEGYVDYLPGVGTRVVIKGEVKGILPGKDLYDALLKIWIGENPVSRHFKEEILNYKQDQLAAE